MIRKLLVANRGEIAIRVFRAAFELGLRTVAVYTHPDRASLHRQKADESYQVGDPASPLGGYLGADGLVQSALQVGADAIHPGYGFLSESPVLAAACADAGITFVGPPPEVLRLTGDKMRARQAAAGAGLPVLRASGPVVRRDEALAAAQELGYPVFVKAAAGGGGRGLRLVSEADALPAAVDTAIREAEGAFGDGTVFLEQAVTRPRHIEVQVLGAADGIIHLFERDCSVQRRHQKVVELAPAPNLDPDLRSRLCEDAIAFAQAVGYRNAGTVEFLVDPDGRHVFIEMNPRIQVEHTVTEEVTDVDLVQAQLRIAGGATLAELGLTQERITIRGQALQCRITTEDPANDFRPDTGTITAFRAPGGAGIRLDGGSGYTGAEVSPYFDSLLVKLTARGPDLAAAASRAQRALAEFRVRGLHTNVAFLRALLSDADFLAGRLSTSFLADKPELLGAPAGADRATKALRLVADVTVNRPHGTAPEGPHPTTQLPALAADVEPPAGSRQRLKAAGPDAFARDLRASAALAVTDTTMRDAHQSLFATRMRTADMLVAAPHLAHGLPQLWSAEVWGGATYDTALRFLWEDPWDRLARLRQAWPNTCFQMLLRGANAVGYSRYPAAVVRAFVLEAHAQGIDVFRVFDALNHVDRMRPAIDACREAGALVEGALCYTGDLSDPGERLYTLDYYLDIAEELVQAGAHVLCIKDMAGLLRAPAATTLVRALRERFDTPVHLHTHDTAGGQMATYLAAIQAGVDAVDGATAPLSGMTSQPSLAGIVALTDHTERATGLDLQALIDMEPYWEAVRTLYAPFESGLRAPTGRVYEHEIPGGQLSNLRQQAGELGLGNRFPEIERLYARCNALLGNIVKVTPTSKVVGDLALYLASTGLDPEELAGDPARYDLPASVLGFLRGDLGVPPAGWPAFRDRALKGRETPEPEVELTLAERDTLDNGQGTERRALLNRVLFPGPAKEQEEAVFKYGDVSVLPTPLFLYGLQPGTEIEVELEPGVTLLLELEAVAEPDARGQRTVLCRVNGQTRPVEAEDRSVERHDVQVEKADPNNPGHVAAPLTGVVNLLVSQGDAVTAGQRIGTIEAMKMESAISAPKDGVVSRVALTGTQVEPGDLLLVLEDGPGGSGVPRS